VENCAIVIPDSRFLDVSCDFSLSTACDLALVGLNLRGLANVPSTLSKNIDTNYVLVVNNTNPEQIYFQGYYDTVIRYTTFHDRDVSPLNKSFRAYVKEYAILCVFLFIALSRLRCKTIVK
jgi:hypothetical protein